MQYLEDLGAVAWRHAQCTSYYLTDSYECTYCAMHLEYSNKKNHVAMN